MTALPGNCNKDAKKLLVLLLALYVEMLHYSLVFQHGGARDKTMKVTIYIKINNLSTPFFDPVWANMGSAISENVSKHVTTRELGAF